MKYVIVVGAVVQPSMAIDLTAVFLAGLTGAVFAVQRKFAVTGVLAIAIAAGLGGGMLRDLLLNRSPLALTNPRYLPTVVVAAVVGFFFASLVHRWQLMLDILDPIWMGLFAVIGAQMALNAGQSSWAAILIGCVTAFGGGVVRDILAGETPQLVLPGPINYTAAIIGSVLYVSLVNAFSVPQRTAEWATIAVVFGLRMIALRFGLRAPEPVDLPDAIVRSGKRLLPAAARLAPSGIRPSSARSPSGPEAPSPGRDEDAASGDQEETVRGGQEETTPGDDKATLPS